MQLVRVIELLSAKSNELESQSIVVGVKADSDEHRYEDLRVLGNII